MTQKWVVGLVIVVIVGGILFVERSRRIWYCNRQSLLSGAVVFAYDNCALGLVQVQSVESNSEAE